MLLIDKFGFLFVYDVGKEGACALVGPAAFSGASCCLHAPSWVQSMGVKRICECTEGER